MIYQTQTQEEESWKLRERMIEDLDKLTYLDLNHLFGVVQGKINFHPGKEIEEAEETDEKIKQEIDKDYVNQQEDAP